MKAAEIFGQACKAFPDDRRIVRNEVAGDGAAVAQPEQVELSVLAEPFFLAGPPLLGFLGIQRFGKRGLISLCHEHRQ